MTDLERHLMQKLPSDPASPQPIRPLKNNDPKKDEIAKLVNSLEMAIQNAYSGSAEHGSFLRRGGGEWTPSVFMTLDRLKQALSDYEALRETNEEGKSAE
jgi:hypothetical protein